MSETSRTNFLLAEKPAYILTVLLSILGWSAVYIIESITSLPTVEYEIDITDDKGEKKIEVTLHNLSRKDELKGLKFGIATVKKQHGEFSKDVIVIESPAFSTSSSNITTDKAAVHFTIPQLYPNAKVSMQVNYSGSDVPEFRLIKSDQPVLMVKWSLGTWATKNVFSLIFTVVIFVFLGLVSIIILAFKKRN